MKNIMLILAVLFIAASCTNTTKSITVDQQPLNRPNLVIPNIDQFNAKPVDWIIVTEKNAKTVFANLAKQGNGVVLFAVTSKGYENIAVNTKESLRVILQQQAVVNGYKKYYIKANNTIYNYNKSVNVAK